MVGSCRFLDLFWPLTSIMYSILFTVCSSIIWYTPSSSICFYCIELSSFWKCNIYVHNLFYDDVCVWTDGFWENPEQSKTNKPGSGRTPTKPSTATTSAHHHHNHQTSNKPGSHPSNPAANNRVNKKKGKDESETVKKLFTDTMSPADTFTQWCKTSLNTMKVHASIDSKLN